MLTEADVSTLDLTFGQQELLGRAIYKLGSGSGDPPSKVENKIPVTTKSLAKNSGLDGILKKIEGMGSLDDSLLGLGAIAEQ